MRRKISFHMKQVGIISKGSTIAPPIKKKKKNAQCAYYQARTSRLHQTAPAMPKIKDNTALSCSLHKSYLMSYIWSRCFYCNTRNECNCYSIYSYKFTSIYLNSFIYLLSGKAFIPFRNLNRFIVKMYPLKPTYLLRLTLLAHHSINPLRADFCFQETEIYMYRQVSNIRRTKFQQLKDSRTALRLSLPNPLKPHVKSRMKM